METHNAQNADTTTRNESEPEFSNDRLSFISHPSSLIPSFRPLYLIAKTIFTEALRRKEIYSIVLLTVILLGWGASFRFFDISGLHKFYQEIALKVMSISTMITVIVLASRQLPREFESRTIYTVLAKPISRTAFLFGKFIGVVSAGCFCFGLFMVVFLASNLIMHFPLQWKTFSQYVYLQFLVIVLVASLAFALSLLCNQDAAITITSLIFLLGQVFTSTITIIYDYVSPVGQAVLKFINYAVPQVSLYDLSAKVVHAWPPISIRVIFMLTCYTAVFTAAYLSVSFMLFRRRSL